MKLFINGQVREVPDTVSTVSQLLEHLGIAHKLVVVQRNEQILKQEEYESANVSDGDKIEIVHFVGGG